MARIEDEWHVAFKDMTEVPFSDALRQRILQQVQDNALFEAKDTIVHHSRRRARMPQYQPWLAAVSGLCMVVAFVWGVVSWQQAGPSHKQANPLPAAIRATARQTTTASATRRNVPFGLVDAPISLSNVGTGSESGYAANSFVIANLTNLGTNTLREGQVFGVLWFSKSNRSNTPLSSDWATFVDFHMANGSKSLNPGDTGIWSFRPVGAPINASGALTEAPHLAFYKAGLASGSVADTVWPQTALTVDSVKFTQRHHGPGWQSFQVTAALHNPSNAPVSLEKTRAVVWFSSHPMTDWTEPDVVRFMATPTPVSGGMSVKPGATDAVYFRLIGSDKTDFLGMIPHVAFIER